MSCALPALSNAKPASSGFGEFLVVGGATLFLFPFLWLLRAALGLDTAELAVGFVMFHAASVINDPHFSVTYLLFYKDAKNWALGSAFSAGQRARYFIAGVLVPLALLAWTATALATGSAEVLGWMIQFMFFLVGWHYVKQAFGVLVVLSARRGVRYSASERKAVLLHCFAGWAYAWASPADSGREVAEKGVVYTTFAHPPGLEFASGVMFGASTLVLLWALARKTRADGRLPPLAPLAGLLITVWLWTAFSSVDPLMVYVIPALHSLQYLYFVALMRRNRARENEGPPHFGRPVKVQLATLSLSAVLLGWLLFRGVPEFLDGVVFRTAGSMDPLGPTPYFAALFTIVNIHHYFMDTVIWRRENPETRYLER